MRRASMTRTLTLLMTAALMPLVSGTAVAAPSTSATEGRDVLGAGAHVDVLYPEITGGAMTINARTPDGIEDPEDLVMHIPEVDSTQADLPDGYEFLAPEGTPVWLTSQTQNPDTVWPGWSTEGIGKQDIMGTMAFSVTGFSYAGPAEDPRFAVTAPGGILGDKVSQLFVLGTLFTDVTVEAGGHEHADWVFTDPGTYDIDFSATATTLDDEETLTDTTTVRFVVGPLQEADGDVVEQDVPEATRTSDELEIIPDAVDAEYFVGQSITLMAISPELTDESVLRWHLKRDGESDFTEIPDEAAQEFATKPDRDLERAQVYAELLDADGDVLQQAEPITLRVVAPEVATNVTVAADQQEYEIGDTAVFTSQQDPQAATHYHWYYRLPGEDLYTWVPESREAGLSLPITAEHAGAEVLIRVFNDSHSVIAESPPVHLTVTDETPAVSQLDLDDGGDTYEVGQDLDLAVSGEAPGDISYEWLYRHNGENPFWPIEDADGPEARMPAGETWSQVLVRAVSADGTTQGESVLPIHTVVDADVGADQVDDASPIAEASETARFPSATVVLGLVVVALAIGAAVLLRLRGGHQPPA